MRAWSAAAVVSAQQRSRQFVISQREATKSQPASPTGSGRAMISAFRSQDHRIQAEFEAPDNSNTVGVMSGYWRGQRACPASIGYLAEPILRICRRY